ncbi:MAG TPA: hypothetical protein VNL16_13570 [Chloroflexota bacterium]|nr:hypothetical protein [Chloroflexota bacterium]
MVWRNRLYPALPCGRQPGGAPRMDRDGTIVLTMLVRRARRLSVETTTN